MTSPCLFCSASNSKCTFPCNEAFPGVWGNMEKMVFISGEQGNKGQILRRIWEQRQFWGTGNIRKQILDFGGTGEQANLFQGNKGTGTPSPPPPPPGRASVMFNLPRSPSMTKNLIRSILAPVITIEQSCN